MPQLSSMRNHQLCWEMYHIRQIQLPPHNPLLKKSSIRTSQHLLFTLSHNLSLPVLSFVQSQITTEMIFDIIFYWWNSQYICKRACSPASEDGSLKIYIRLEKKSMKLFDKSTYKIWMSFSSLLAKDIMKMQNFTWPNWWWASICEQNRNLV